MTVADLFAAVINPVTACSVETLCREGAAALAGASATDATADAATGRA